jgi:hypothetical protein
MVSQMQAKLQKIPEIERGKFFEFFCAVKKYHTRNKT